jgi:hypothetical protein
MKGLDTPVLLGLLHGDEAAVGMIRKLSGDELATTEWNLFELEAVNASGPVNGAIRRRRAIEKLRRRLVVIPIGSAAVQRAAAWLRREPRLRPDTTLLMLAAAEAQGCSEWITDRGASGKPSGCRMRLKVIHS